MCACSHPAMQQPASPLYLLRGSGMLSAVREAAAVEALAMDASDLVHEAAGHKVGFGGSVCF